MSREVLQVSVLVNYLKNRLEADPYTQKVMVEGELSNFSSYRSGHWYFTLKDSEAQIRCAMFASSNRRVTFTPKDGDKVIVQGDISVFTGRGELQLIVTAMRPSGIGDLFLQYEKLKKKLSDEGLFDEAHKKPLPAWPMRIGLVTGRNTAARADVITTVGRRWPVAEIFEYPVLVQGTGSAEQIRKAMRTMDRMNMDVILLVRGGGSIEDLWSFNDEQLARIIYGMHTPVVTGVGHEVDYTIADFVSDLRAPTPTGAAERATPNIEEVRTRISTYKENILDLTEDKRLEEASRLEQMRTARVFLNPERLISEKSFRVNAVFTELQKAIEKERSSSLVRISRAQNALTGLIQAEIAVNRVRLDNDASLLKKGAERKYGLERDKLSAQINLLDAYSPLKVLSRGYAVAEHDGHAVTDAGELKPGDSLLIRVHHGKIHAETISTDREE